MARVLLIDEDDTAAREIMAMLEVEHLVQRANDGHSASFLLSAATWEVVVLDPAVSGVDGVTIMRNIREVPNPPEVVVVTLQQQLDQVVQTLRAGAFEFVPKPVEEAALLKAVSNAAQLRSLRDDKRRLEQRQRKEREHLAALVEERTQQMQQVFANVPGLLYRIVVDREGTRRFSFVSSNCEELLELSRDVLMSDAYRFDALVHPDDTVRFRRSRATAEQRLLRFRFEGRFILRSGKTKWLQCMAKPTERFSGEVVWDGIITDVTERNELQSQLLLTDRLASIGSMAAAVAHEVNNPLAYIKSHLALLEKRILREPFEPESAELLKEVIEGVDRIEDALSALRTFARSAEESPLPVVLTHVIDASVRLASNEIRHRATLRRAYESSARVVADESALGQLFLNLLIAVAQSIPEGDAPGYEITLRVWTRSPEYVGVEISDNGPGLPAEVLERAFEPLSTHPLRAGAGLYVCQRIVSSLGGQITAGRSKDGGNRFRLTLPAQPPESEMQNFPNQVLRNNRVARVLVVDDEELVVKALCRAFEGHQVVTAKSGREAIELIRHDGPFDLVLCDVMMPDLTGADVYEAAREVGSEKSIVFVTGGAFTSTARSFLESVPNRRIEKPFSRDRVRSLLTEVEEQR